MTTNQATHLSAQHTRCAIFGGTFDPIHLGHVEAVREVLAWGGFSRIHYIPSAVPPHRSQPGASAIHRLAMAQIATADEPQLEVDDIELNRLGPSYTVDTVTALAAQFKDTQWSLILGLDALLELDQWHRWENILEMVDIVAMVRPGWQLPETLPQWLLTAGFAWADIEQPMIQQNQSATAKIQLLPIQPNPISATKIRHGLAAGEDVSDMLHPGVWHYIQSNQLYVQ